VAERGGATRVQELAGGAGYVEQERTGGREIVWELAGDGVGSIVCSEGLFIGQEAGGGDGQKVAGAGGGGGLATCNCNAGRGGLGSVLAGFGLGIGALWVGVGETTPVGIVQRAEGKRGGSGCVLPLLLHVSWPGSGQGRLGSTTR
jgi:hypothetical protein